MLLSHVIAFCDFVNFLPRDSLDLAFKYFTSSTLTVRLAGLNQITVSNFYLIVVMLLYMYTFSLGLLFFDNCRKFSHAHWLIFIVNSGQEHEFIIYTMRQQARADNWTICFPKRQTGVSS